MEINPVLIYLPSFLIYIAIRVCLMLYASKTGLKEYKISKENKSIRLERHSFLMFFTHLIFFFHIFPFIVIFSPFVMQEGYSYTTFYIRTIGLIIVLIVSFLIQKKRSIKQIAYKNGRFYLNNTVLASDFYLTLYVKSIYYFLGNMGYSLKTISGKTIFTSGKDKDLVDLKNEIKEYFKDCHEN